MKILFVVQAYGPDAIGGAEMHCRLMAENMATRGHDVSVLTSCAKSYKEWANEYKPGESVQSGVRVIRFAVDHIRDIHRFSLLSQRVLTGHKPVPLFLQQHWIDQQGPHLPQLEPWLREHAGEFDVVSFFTYLYFPTVRGLPVATSRTTTVLHPLAHDEPQLTMPVFRHVFSMPHALIFNIEEEADLVHDAFRTRQPELIAGIGTDLDVAGDASTFRAAFGIGDAPYLVCVGRIDAHKGSDELYDQFVAYKQRNPSDLKLIFVGQAVKSYPEHNDIVMTGYVDDPTKHGAVAGAVASLHPSYFESFSMALIEAWVQRKPTLVNGRCAVFLGQVSRSGGGIPYCGYAQFEAALDLILQDPSRACDIGSAGRAYVEEHFTWDKVTARYEGFLENVMRRRSIGDTTAAASCE